LSRGGASIWVTGAKPHLIFGVQKERRVDFQKAVCILHLSFTERIRQFNEETGVLSPLPST
jgi:hypothetical protein